MNTTTTVTDTLLHHPGGGDHGTAILMSSLSKFVSLQEWGLDHYTTFTMPFDRLSETWPIVACFVVGYLLMVWTVQPHTKSKPSKQWIPSILLVDLATARCAWNTCLALYSILGSAHMMGYLFYQIMSSSSSSLSLPDRLYAILCASNDTFDNGPIGFWLLLFVLGKVVELGDTVFLLCSGKRPIFLHWYHHATILPSCWYALQAKIPMFRLCATINYTIHAVMYSYFALNDTEIMADNHAARLTWAKRITTLQCTQFAICLGVIAVGAYDRFFYQDHVDTIPWLSVVLSWTILSSYLFLFLQFAETKYGYQSQIRQSILEYVAHYYHHYQCHWHGGQSMTRKQQQAQSQCSKSNNTPAVPKWNNPAFSLQQRFQEACKMAAMLYGVATETDLLNLYGCYKHVKDGSIPPELVAELGESSCSDSGALSTAQDKDRAKLLAWSAVQNLTIEEAQMKYIAVMDDLNERSKAATLRKQQQASSRSIFSNHTTTLQSNATLGSNSASNPNTSMLYPVKIVGHGMHLPQRIVSNHDIETRGNFALSSQETKRTGVRERRFANVDGGENLIQNGARAIRAACAQANIPLEDLDLIVGGFGGHQVLPDDAVLVQRELGLGDSGIRAFTVHATCLSFVVAMEVAGSVMTTQSKYRTVAVFCSSISSVGINRNDPHTAGLFGDGAAAVILRPSTDLDGGSGIHGVHMYVVEYGTAT